MATTTNLSSLVINYLTQAQYDAAAAGGTLNENQLYLTPAETLATVATSGSYNDLSNKPTLLTKASNLITLSASGWSNNEQTINVSGVTATNDIVVAPLPSAASAYSEAAIICTEQGAGTLKFTCETVPTNAIAVNVLVLN